MTYHIGRNGHPAICRADSRECPLGGPHGTMKELEQAIAAEFKPAKHHIPSDPWPTRLIPEELTYWQTMDKEFGAIYRNGTFLILGKRGASPYFCNMCFTRLPPRELYDDSSWEVPCDKCGEPVTDGLCGVTLKIEDEPLLNDQEVFKRDWYHYTTRAEWETLLNQEGAPLIHLGNQTASLHRERELRHTSTDLPKVYKLRLKSTATVLHRIHDEDPGEIKLLKKAEMVDSPAVVRYLNYYEDPGSISLLGDPRAFELVEVRTLDYAKKRKF